jgi:hypothetical protein
MATEERADGHTEAAPGSRKITHIDMDASTRRSSSATILSCAGSPSRSADRGNAAKSAVQCSGFWVPKPFTCATVGIAVVRVVFGDSLK